MTEALSAMAAVSLWLRDLPRWQHHPHGGEQHHSGYLGNDLSQSPLWNVLRGTGVVRVLIPKLGGERPQTHVIEAKLIKASN